MQSTCDEIHVCSRYCEKFYSSTCNLPEIIKHIVASNAWLKESKNKKKHYLNKYKTRRCDAFQSIYSGQNERRRLA